MGDDIFVGDLEKEIMLLDGVIGIIRMKIYKIYNGGYSSDVCPLPETSEESVCGSEPSEGFSLKGEGSISREIDLDATDYVLYGDYNSSVPYTSEMTSTCNEAASRSRATQSP